MLELGTKQKKLMHYEERMRSYFLQADEGASFLELEQNGLLTVLLTFYPPQEQQAPEQNTEQPDGLPSQPEQQQKGSDPPAAIPAAGATPQERDDIPEIPSMGALVAFVEKSSLEIEKLSGRQGEEIYIVKETDLTTAQLNYIKHLEIRLSDEGLKAFDIIIEAVINEIGAKEEEE